MVIPTLLRAVTAATIPVVLGACNPLAPRDGPDPPPNRLVAIEAACRACVASDATHPCPASRAILCSGIPTARPGDTLILCALGAASQGRLGPLEWRSSDPGVVSVSAASLTVTHCVNEIGNAVLQAKRPGTAIIIVDELEGSAVVRTVFATVVVSSE